MQHLGPYRSRNGLTRCFGNVLESAAMNRRILLTVGALLAANSAAWANMSCGATTYNLGTDPTAGSNALVAPGSSLAGCEQANAQFTNFGYTNDGGAPAGSNV